MKKRFACMLAPLALLTACESYAEDESTLVTVLRVCQAYGYGGVKELTGKSDYIAVINVAEAEVNNLQTLYTVETAKSIYGDETEDVRLAFIGGSAAENVNDPLMEIGDTFLVFARKNDDGTYAVLGGSQGRFVIEDGLVYSLNCADMRSESTQSPPSNIMSDGVPFDDFIGSIEGYLFDITTTAESQTVQCEMAE